jgi:hypothetical protein
MIITMIKKQLKYKILWKSPCSIEKIEHVTV